MPAKTKSAPDDAAPAKTSPLKNKKVLLMIVLVLAVAGGAYKFVLAPKPKPAPVAGGDVVTMDPTTLNLAGGHYLKIGVAVQLVKGKASSADFQSSMAQEIVIDDFSNRSVSSLTNSKRQQLTKQLAVHLKKAYPQEVYQVFLTQFVTQ